MHPAQVPAIPLSTCPQLNSFLSLEPQKLENKVNKFNKRLQLRLRRKSVTVVGGSGGNGGMAAAGDLFPLHVYIYLLNCLVFSTLSQLKCLVNSTQLNLSLSLELEEPFLARKSFYLHCDCEW